VTFRFVQRWGSLRSIEISNPDRFTLEERDRQLEDYVSALPTSPVGVADGGTGITSYTVGDLLYASAATTLSRLADVATGNALISGGVGVAPLWGKIGLTTHVSGVLPEGNGGTNQSAYTTGDLLQATAGNTLGKLAAVATGNALISGGVSTASSWGKIGLTTHVSGVLAEGNGGTNQSTYTTGDLLQATAGNTLGKLAAVATGNALISGGVSTASSWGKIGLTTHVSGVLPEANGGTNQSTYTTGDLLQATAGNTLGKLAAVATGNALISGGVSTASSWGKIGLTTHVSGTLGPTNGGTGVNTVTTGDLLYGSAANTWAKLADIATGNALISGGVGVAPSWGKIGLTTHVSGTLPAANGGTGLTSLNVISFTPSWTNLTVGNGTQEAYYWQLGGLQVFELIMTFGTTSAITGLPRVTIPNSATGRLIPVASTCTLIDASAGTHYIGIGQVVTVGSAVDVYVVNASATRATREAVSSTVPMTWTTSDTIRLAVVTLVI